MEGTASPRSQINLRDGEYQYENLSVGALMQSSVAALENECAALEQEIEMKSHGLQELKENCAKQAENISKQQLELEHLKMKTYAEEINRKAFLAKYSSLRDKSETLEGYMREWFKGLNQTLSDKDDRQQFSDYLALKVEKENAECLRLEQMYNCAYQQANRIIGDLEEYRTRARNEFEDVKTELKSELSFHTQQERELEEQLRNAQKDCAERALVIEVLKQQNEEPKRKIEHLKNELAAEIENVKSVTNNLQTSLQEELIRKANLSAKVEVTDKMIHETNISLRDTELEIKLLDSKHKQLISKGEEYTKELKSELEELSCLQADYNSKRVRFYTLSEIDKENSSLKLKIDELKKTHETYNNKLANINVSEQYQCEKLEDLNKFIREKETERDNVIKERLDMEEEIKRLQKEFESNALERNKERAEINKHYVELKGKNTSFMAKIDDLADLMREAGEDKEELENVITKLKKELQRAKAISEESDCELFSYLDESKVILSGLREQMTVVDEMVAKSQQDCEQAQRDIVEGEELKVQVTRMEEDLSTQHADYAQSLTDQQASCEEQLETLNKQLKDLKDLFEIEFKNKEQKKLDAMLELKESKAKVTDYHRKQNSIQTEIKKTKHYLEKYNNLIQKLENKLKVVAEVATVSQSVKDLSSQEPRHTLVQSKKDLPPQTKLAAYPPHETISENVNRPQGCTTQVSNMSAASQLPRKTQVTFPSPGSSSSGISFNVDDMELKKMEIKRKSSGSGHYKQVAPKLPQKRVPASSTSKQDSESDDGWNFFS